MQYITIKLNSVVAPVCVGAVLTEISRLNQLAKAETVELHFYDDVCRIVGEKSRKVKVPAKAIKSGSELVKWIEERINKAWK